jgi:hypothetical protein
MQLVRQVVHLLPLERECNNLRTTGNVNPELNGECLTDRIMQVIGKRQCITPPGRVLGRIDPAKYGTGRDGNPNLLLSLGDLMCALKLTVHFDKSREALHRTSIQKLTPELKLLVEMLRLSITHRDDRWAL